MMNYYTISRSVAESLGIDLHAHRANDTHAVVSDMDLRRVAGFDTSPQQLQQRYGVEPMSQQRIAAVLSDPQWKIIK